MIAAPKTTYCIAADRPMITSICVSSVSASAASHVDVALARPPASDAPAITTAAIGASRYAEPKAGSMLMLDAREQDGRDGVERARRGVGEHDVRAHAQARHPRRPRVRAHRLEAPAEPRVADDERDDERDREPRPEDVADPERLVASPTTKARPARCGWFVTTSREYLLLQARTIWPTASVTISGFSRRTPDEDAVDEPDEHADAEGGEDRDGKVVV